MEANTTHTPGVSSGPLNGGSGLRGRITALVGLQRRDGAERSNGKVAEEATVRLDRYLRDSRAIAMHHRRVRGSRSEVSHLVVGPAGLTVVDSRHYKVPGIKIDARGARRNSRARSDLVKPVLDQVEEVRRLLADTPYADVPIDGALARSKVEGPRILQGLNAPRVIVSGVRTIATEASREGDLDARRVRALVQFLDDALE